MRCAPCCRLPGSCSNSSPGRARRRKPDPAANAEHATWNERLLAEQLKELSLAELDFSIDVIGFEMAEIDLKIASLDEQSGAEDPDDEVPEPAAIPPVSKPGDGMVNLSGRGMLVVSVARQLESGNSFVRLSCCPAQAKRA